MGDMRLKCDDDNCRCQRCTMYHNNVMKVQYVQLIPPKTPAYAPLFYHHVQTESGFVPVETSEKPAWFMNPKEDTPPANWGPPGVTLLVPAGHVLGAHGLPLAPEIPDPYGVAPGQTMRYG